MIKRLFLLALIVVLSLGNIALAQDPNNYPPDDKTVVIDSTNLPIVWIDVDGAMIDREERTSGRMKIIHNGKGKLNYGDTIAHPGQHIDYEGYIAIRYRGNSSYSLSDKKPYSFRTLSQPLEQGYDKKKVPVALELTNNSGMDFKGLGGIIQKGTKFYLVGEIDPEQFKDDSRTEIRDRVFTQDYTTTLNIKVTGLEKAYNVVPNLLSPRLEMGIELTPKWVATTPDEVLF